MLNEFFFDLKNAGLPVSIREYLDLLEALQRRVIPPNFDDLYYLARLTLIKSETHFDRFDKTFARRFRDFNDRPEAENEAMLDAMLDQFMYGAENSNTATSHDASAQGDNITSPFAEGGNSQDGIRIGGDSQNGRARKVWEARAYRDYDTSNRLTDRNMSLALRRLRKYVRQGITEDELDMDGTLKATANNAGRLEIKMQAERRNRFKVVVLLDVGGTMFEHAALATNLFCAAKSEFRNMEFYYFHNCIYDQLWKQGELNKEGGTSTWDILHRYGQETRVVFVGDAKMGVAEIQAVNGSIMNNNEETGEVWLERFTCTYPHFVWLNPEPQASWDYRESIALVRNIMQNRMFPLTVEGIEHSMKLLSK